MSSLTGGKLRLEFEQTPVVAGFHQLMNEAGRREEGDREAALAGRKAERQTDMRLSRAGISALGAVVLQRTALALCRGNPG
jgi:hypothetical protein